jgi:sulfite reductase alpha subunit-like flavoprotein
MAENEGMVKGLERGNPPEPADAGTKGPVTFATSLDSPTGSSNPTALQTESQGESSTQPQESSPQTGVLPGYAAGLSKELKADSKIVAFTGKFKSMDDLVKSAMEADSKLGSMVSIPKDGAPEEELKAFYSKLGVPEKPEDYKLSTKDTGLSDSDLAEFKKQAYEMHLTNAQAQKLVDNAAKNIKDLATQYHERMKQAAAETEAALKKEWGQNYQTNYNLMQRAWRTLGDPELAKELEESGFGNSRAFAKFLSKVGSLMAEDRTAESGLKKIPQQSGISRPGL